MTASKLCGWAGGLALCVLLFQSCGQDYNSNSGDDKLGRGATPQGDVCQTEDGARFCAATAILAKRCYRCHPDWFGYSSDALWIRSGRVVPGNSAASPVINRLINAGSTMPLEGGALPADEYAALQQWVNGISTTRLRGR